jgi:hypothetical protein
MGGLGRPVAPVVVVGSPTHPVMPNLVVLWKMSPLRGGVRVGARLWARARGPARRSWVATEPKPKPGGAGGPLGNRLIRITSTTHDHPLPPITHHYRPLPQHYRINSVLPACRKPAGGLFFGGGAAAAGLRRRGSSAGCVKTRGEGRSLFQTALQFRTV